MQNSQYLHKESESTLRFDRGSKTPEWSIGRNTGPHHSIFFPEASFSATVVLELSYHSKNIIYSFDSKDELTRKIVITKTHSLKLQISCSCLF